jgi:hypothetical protein
VIFNALESSCLEGAILKINPVCVVVQKQVKKQ